MKVKLPVERVEVSRPVWTLEMALNLIRAIQADLKPLGFHVALAGGVLNKGMSIKDLDLVFLPLWNEEQPPVDPLIRHLLLNTSLVDTDREADTENAPSHVPNPFTPYRFQAQWKYEEQRVDIFIV